MGFSHSRLPWILLILLLGASFDPAVAKEFSYVTNHGEITITESPTHRRTNP